MISLNRISDITKLIFGYQKRGMNIVISQIGFSDYLFDLVISQNRISDIA